MADSAATTNSDILRKVVNFFKSVPAEQLEDIMTVDDIWNETDGLHKNPTRAEVKIGKPQESSGGGAERMVREYSDPAPQMGMVATYEQFSSMLRDFGKALQAESRKSTMMQTAALVELLTAKAAAPAAKAEQPDSVLAKAELKLKKARTELRKADMADMEDKEEREEAKSFLEQAAVALKAAKRFLVKAEDEEAEDDEDRAEKARADYAKLVKALKKAEDESTKREEDEMKEAEKARQVAEAVTAKAEPKEEDDEEKARLVAEAAAKASAPVDTSVRDQLTILQTSVKGLMETVMAGSKGTPMPTFSKGAPIDTIATRVEEAIEDGTLESPLEIMKAQTMITRMRAVQEGKMDAAVFESEVSLAPDNVRQLFAPSQAAA